MADAALVFASYCCELLAVAVGPCVARRMFGGWGISTGGMTIAIVADLGQGEKLWLKAEGALRSHYEAAGSQRFTYKAGETLRSINYYSAPAEAMESPQVMAPWARQALECALKAQSVRLARPLPRVAPRARRASANASRRTAPTPSTTARRKSDNG